LSHDPDDPGEDENSSKNTELGKGIGAGMKNLGPQVRMRSSILTVADKHLREYWNGRGEAPGLRALAV
jgi:hypothetical protein